MDLVAALGLGATGDVLAALALGILLGAITGMPLGVINVAIVDAAIARERTHARGLAVGGALADATHTLLAFIGLGRLVTARPEVTRYLAIGAAVVMIVFAIASWRRRRPSGRVATNAAASPTNDAATSMNTVSIRGAASSTNDVASSTNAPSTSEAEPSVAAAGNASDTSLVRGVASGLALTLPNPAALAAWVAVAAMIWPSASIAVAVAIAAGVGVGSAAWFLALGRVVANVRPDHRALRVIPKVALVAFVGIAIVGVVRAF